MGVTILRNASVLDPEKGELAPGQSVVVEGGRIVDVGPGLSGPDDALVLDAGGRTVMPGLIDAHTHPAVVDDDLFGMAEWPPTYVAARAGRALEGMLARGFTTIRDVGGGDIIRSEVQSPADLIRAATSTAARLLQLEGQVGAVAPGAFADLLVIDGNPLADIRVLTTPAQTLRLIMKEGRIYKNQL
jgi:imidazolonepropionase-like amidohydrolase